MGDDPTIPPRRYRDPRRQTGREDEPVATARAVVVSERELDAFRRRIESNVDQRIADLAAGLEERVKHVVKIELAPHMHQLSKLDAILDRLEADRRERDEYRARREERESVAAEQRTQQLHELQMLKGKTEAALMPVESTRKYRAALFGTLATILAALVGLAGVAIGSHLHP